MKSMTKVFFLVVALFCSRILMAEEKAQTNGLSYFYDAEMFQWNYDLFGGLTLNFHNQSSQAIFGIKDAMKNALAQYDDTRKQYNSYRWKTTSGNILAWSGLTVACAGIPFLHHFGSSENGREVVIGVMLGGLVSEIIGVFVLYSGQENIFNAVNLYNKHKVTDLR
jgi:hypothetical protein